MEIWPYNLCHLVRIFKESAGYGRSWMKQNTPENEVYLLEGSVGKILTMMVKRKKVVAEKHKYCSCANINHCVAM